MKIDAFRTSVYLFESINRAHYLWMEFDANNTRWTQRTSSIISLTKEISLELTFQTDKQVIYTIFRFREVL